MFVRALLATTALAFGVLQAGAQEMAPAAPAPQTQLDAVGLTPPTVMSEGRAVSAEEMMANTIIGSTVYTGVEAEAEVIGTINDLVIGPLGEVSTAVIGVGGFLGLGEKDVAIGFTDIVQVPGPDGDIRFVLETTADILTAAPAFVYPDQTPDSVPLTEAEEAEQLVEGDPNAIAIDPDLTTDQPEMAGTENAPIALPAPSAAELQGMGVYGQNDEPIGTIGTVLQTPEGAVDAIIVDVGGFLGLGAKPVAVAFENLTFATDTSGAPYLFLNSTREQLEAQPAYDPGTYAEDRANQLLVVTP